jgi:hypothetical protein
MILPTKHIHPDRALIAVGGEILRILREPMTVSRLWDELRSHLACSDERAPVNYDWFILALDLLFMIRAVEFDRGLVRKAAP